MPELPEVTTVIGLLKKEVIGKTIADIDIFYKKAINEGDTETFVKEVKGRTIEDIIRHGKFIEAAQSKAQWAGQTQDAIDKIATFTDGRYKYERFPIPTSVINEGKGIITQNPGF